MAITNYSDVEVRGNISSTKQGRLIGVVSTAITEGDTATGYQYGDTVMYDGTFYTVDGGVWRKTDLGNASLITVDSAFDTASENPVQNKVIAEIVPAQASALNQLADKDFVNSSVATATGTFKGTYDVVSDLGLSTSATTAQVATALLNVVQSPTKNDYVFVKYDYQSDPGNIDKYERYKYSGTVWEYEYTLNNSSFTAAQWAAINSGMTAGLVSEVTTKISVWDAKQDQVVGGTGISIGQDGVTIGHSNAVAEHTSTYVGSATSVPRLKYDAQGHIVETDTATIYPPTTAGTSGQVWMSKGDGVGKWSDVQRGSAVKPIYINSMGQVTEGTEIKAPAYQNFDQSSKGIDATSDDNSIPSSKAVYEALQSIGLSVTTYPSG